MSQTEAAIPRLMPQAVASLARMVNDLTYRANLIFLKIIRHGQAENTMGNIVCDRALNAIAEYRLQAWIEIFTWVDSALIQFTQDHILAVLTFQNHGHV